jgi:hypothetical protein
MANHLQEADGFAPPGQAVVLVDLVAVVHERAWISDKLPTDQSGIPAVHRVAEHTLDRVLPQEAEERCRLDGSKLVVLLPFWPRFNDVIVDCY